MGQFIEGRYVDKINKCRDGILKAEGHKLMHVVELGRILNEVKGQVDHGKYESFLMEYWGWSVHVARRYRAVADFVTAKMNSGVNFEDLRIDYSAVLALTSSTCPAEAVQEVLDTAKEDRVSKSVAAEIIKKHKPKKDPNEGKKRCPTCNEFYHPDDFGAGLYCLECQERELAESRSAMEPQQPGSGTKSPFADVRVMHKAVEDMKPELRDVFVSDLLEKYGMEAEPTTAPNEELQTPLQQIKVIWDGCTTRQRREIKRAVDGWQVSNSKDDPIIWQNAFDAFWQRVHSKKGKDKAETAFKKAVNRKADKDDMPRRDSAAKIIEAMMVFADSPEANPDDRTAIHPATWLNQGRYDDDPATWHSKNGTAKKKENFYS